MSIPELLPVLALAFVEGVSLVVSWLNVGHTERAVAEGEADTEYTVFEDGEGLAEFVRASALLFAVRSVLRVAALGAVLYSGLFAEAVAAVESTGLSATMRGTVLLFGGWVGLRVLETPVVAARGLLVKNRYRRRRLAAGEWFAGYLRHLVNRAVMVGALAYGIPVWVSGLLSADVAVLLVGTVVGVVLAIPLLGVKRSAVVRIRDDPEPLRSRDHWDAVLSVADRAGLDCDRVLVVDTGEVGTRSNVFVAGLPWRSKAVVVPEGLVERLDPSALQWVVAQQLAGKRRARWGQRLALWVAHSVVLPTAVLVLALRGGWVAGVTGAGAWYAQVALAVPVAWAVHWVAKPVRNRLSVRFERAADEFATDLTGARAGAGALAALADTTFRNPHAHPWSAAVYRHSRPPSERIAAVRAHERRQSPPETPRSAGRHRSGLQHSGPETDDD